MKKSTILLIMLFVFTCVTTSFAEDGSAIDEGSAKAKQAAQKIPVEKEEAVKDEVAQESDSSGWAIAPAAKAMIQGTSEGSEVSGTVDFVQTGDGVQVVASLSGVTPAGKHGIHVHEKGSCDDGGKAAGGHFNPAGTKHGLLPRDGHGKAHVGDMGNIEIDANGSGSLVVFLPGLSLTEGHRNVTGKAVILHAKEDDFGQPTGNAGGRIGCGIIALNK